MVRRIKKGIVGVIDWFLYSVLSTKQKEFLAGFLSKKQKEKMKRIIKPGKKQAQMRHVDQVKYKLYNLGFTDRGLEELKALYNRDNQPHLKRLAAWELALWHANQYTEADAEQCITYLPDVTRGVSDTSVLRRAAIVEAESLHILGKIKEAKSVIQEALASIKHADLYLAMASLQDDMNKRVKWINKAFSMTDEDHVALLPHEDATDAYDHLYVPKPTHDTDSTEDAKVTVIIPVYNAASVIDTSLTSIQNQTWTNLEILIVDDCSTDNTYEMAQKYADTDDRIQVLQTETNSGAYTARNTALKIATGDFVTINDADDWSHPNKIRTQAQHLINHTKLMGNFSQQARAMNDLTFYRRGKPGEYIFPNMSSLMFRRKPVMDALGYWDSVRFAGDSEFLKRVKIIFGEKSVPAIKGAPLSFQRQSADSLTGDSAFGFPGFFFGVRKEYAEAHEYYHATHPGQLKYEFPMTERPFPIPEPMLPQREAKDTRKHFDVVIASEFRLLGGTNMSNIEEIKAQKKMGLKTGLIQLNRYDIKPKRETNPHVRELIDGEHVQMLVYGEKITCDVLIIRHPPILKDRQQYVPDVDAGCIRVIANQTPKKEYSKTGETLYGLEEVDDRVKAYFHKTPVWHPIGPLIRDILLKEHADELTKIHLDADDWINIIDVDEWRRPSRPENQVIKIGRHSRDQYVKWPVSKEALLSVYPNDPAYEIHVLGGASVPEKLLGTLPENWHVQQFGEIHPRDFLRDVDVFIYYTHPELVEAFGRVIFEAMAVGVPVIIPPNYETLFHEAAIYAEPDEVQDNIRQLMNDDAYYAAQVDRALAYVEEHFGYSKHASRLEACFHG
ncbi:MAG TPA: glycosyltransferase [Virgibacillus sp.]|nr:glycosyltransferase [Virgibacillus sp.]